MAFAFGRATPSLRQAPSRCLDNPVPGNIIFSLNGEHHLLLKVLHFRVDKRSSRISCGPVNISCDDTQVCSRLKPIAALLGNGPGTPK